MSGAICYDSGTRAASFVGPPLATSLETSLSLREGPWITWKQRQYSKWRLTPPKPAFFWYGGCQQCFQIENVIKRIYVASAGSLRRKSAISQSREYFSKLQGPERDRRRGIPRIQNPRKSKISTLKYQKSMNFRFTLTFEWDITVFASQVPGKITKFRPEPACSKF